MTNPFDSVLLNKLSKVEKLRKSAEECDTFGDFRGYCKLRAIAAENEAEVYREALRRIEARRLNAGASMRRIEVE